MTNREKYGEQDFIESGCNIIAVKSVLKMLFLCIVLMTLCLLTGCDAYDAINATSKPMSFWTEQDVLLYIKLNNLTIASVYGDIVRDYEGEGQVEGQLDIADLLKASQLEEFELDKPLLKTTGCNRTGCMFCLYGIHLEKSPNRLEKMKITHPKQYDYIMRPESEGGLGYKEKIDWVNEHGNMNIKY